jgi:hypothetical protein
MHPLIRFAAALVFLFLAALSVLARPKSSNPTHSGFYYSREMQIIPDLLPDSGKSWNHDMNPGAPSDETSGISGRICSCQVLNLESSNYDHRNVVLLAEKTDFASSSGFKATRSRIEKEKKQLKKLFYNKVKTVAEMQGRGSCKSMYFRLHSADGQLQLYEILNAD